MLLDGQNRVANADQLYGVSAECGLKRLMQYSGMKLVPDVSTGIDKPDDSKDRLHVDKVWTRYQSYQQGRLAAFHYNLPVQNPFQDWSVHQRYVHRNDIDSSGLAGHRQGAETVRTLIEHAIKDGIL